MSNKSINYETILDRAFTVLEENNEDDLTGVADLLVNELTTKSEVSVDIIYDFAERYGCSIDYLLGRSDTYSVF